MNEAHAAIPALDWRRMPLEDRVLIEASAGTGKTFVLGLIYLRLLLETDRRVESILVATFTDAAAQELRERLRARLIHAQRCLVAPPPTAAAQSDEDRTLNEWLAAFRADPARERDASRRLRMALSDLDRAPVATIHALCQRFLRDYPLESGAAFGSDRIVDEGELIRECVEDFWRRRFLQGPVRPDEASRMLGQKGLADLLRDVRDLLNNEAPILRDRTDVDALIDELRGDECRAQLRLASNRLLYAPRRTQLLKRVGEVAATLEAGGDVVALLAGAKGSCLDTDEIGLHFSATGRAKLAGLRFLEILQALRSRASYHKEAVRGGVLEAALAFCRAEIPRRARARDAQTFSMLIDSVHARLRDSVSGSQLADRLFGEFPVALVDEFQDTDRRQYEIFDRIYQDAGARRRGLLVMIGDPKQAIYGFRGGDIAAYLGARAQVARQFFLAWNFRSSRALVGACNAIYAHVDGGFDDTRIRYQPVQAAGVVDAAPYAVGGTAVARPFFIHRFNGADGGQTKPGLEAAALDDCANRIVELLNDGRQTIAGRPLSPGDIAVLLSKNAQIAALRERLVVRKVPCVGSGSDSVFKTDVADELQLVLEAVLNPGDDRAVRGALSTRLLGATLAELRAWQDDDGAFERELERFALWRERVRAGGVQALVREITALRARVVLRWSDGERMITDLRHLGELLAGEDSGAHGMESACARLAALRRDDNTPATDVADARRLRIESDAARVQLLTIHAAKGLQFPVVFLPMAWSVSGWPRRIVRFHDASDVARIDLGSPLFEANRRRQQREDLQERLRLLYVALTRAQYAVHVYWKAPSKPVDVAVRPGDAAAIDVLIDAAQGNLGLARGEATLSELAAQLEGVAVVEPFGDLGFHYQAPAESPLPLRAREPLPDVRPFIWLHSFSSLVRQVPAREALPAAMDEVDDGDDADVAESATVAAETDDLELAALEAFRGRRFGNAVHQILEELAPGPVWPSQQPLVEACFRAEALRAQVRRADGLDAVGRMLERAVSADLGDGLRLAEIRACDRVREFEFQFRADRAALADLRALCARHGFADLVPPAISGDVLHGMLTGFADLVFHHGGRFHVLDYKTNRLGTRRAGYASAALDAAMAAHHYPLQALIYTLALHRYLRHRLPGYAPDSHLGESWYLFLRGVGLQPGSGVWRQRWPSALVEDASAIFTGMEAAA